MSGAGKKERSQRRPTPPPVTEPAEVKQVPHDNGRDDPPQETDAVGNDATQPEAPLEEQLQSLQTELAEANERWLRSQAELENFRKRMYREMDDVRRFAALPLMRDLLPVVDNLDRAIEAAGQSSDTAGLLEGVGMVSRQLKTLLEQHHCKEMQAVGAAFDHHVHEAVGQEPTDAHAPQTVTRAISTGYLLHDRVVRPAQVFVAVAPPASSEPDSPDDQTVE